MYLQLPGVEKMKFCIQELPILVLVLNQYTTNGNSACKEAVTDIKIVESCPTSIKEMYEAANDMKCAEFAARKNCSNIKYHCFINEYTNETLEVCAPNRFIFGHCTEFNVAGGVIQRHATAKCNDVFPKCDTIYRSMDAYKFPDCYTLVYKARPLKAKTVYGEKDSETIMTATTSVLLALAVILCLTVTVAIFLALNKGRQKSKEERKHLLRTVC